MSERDIALKLIEDAKKMAKEGEEKLAAIDKPKLRHGDYGHTNDGVKRARFFIETSGGEVRHYEDGPCSADPCFCTKADGYSILGNIFDDLKRNSEDLEEFVDKAFGRIHFRRCSDDNRISISIFDGHPDNLHPRADCSRSAANWYLHIDEATEIHQKLGQLIATAKRKE